MSGIRQIRSLTVLVALTPLLAACALFGGAAPDPEAILIDEEAVAEQEVGAERDAPAEEVIEAPLLEAEEESFEGDADVGAAGGLGTGTGDAFAAEPLAVPAAPEAMIEVAPLPETSGEFTEGRSEVVPADAVESVAPQQVLALQAGEIDDNRQWDDYLMYRREFLTDSRYPVHDVDVTGRHVIHVQTAGGLPVLGARVRIFAGQALVSETRTYATGQTLFFPNATPEARSAESFEVSVEKDGLSTGFTLNVNETNEWFVSLADAAPSQSSVNLDVMFLIDATGSMSDEIEQLQSNILSISEQVDALPSRPNTRYGMVTYRDRGDAYVTREYDFTPDVRAFQSDLSNVRAEGGGDYPESLNEALHDAVRGPEWRVEDTVSLIFLVADAPPHLDYANDFDYAEEMLDAARLGIKIHPIASSGLDPQGEYIFRQIAQVTMGHFVFLTYEQEQGDFARPDLAAGGEDYTVEALDELVLRLITDELDALRQQ